MRGILILALLKERASMGCSSSQVVNRGVAVNTNQLRSKRSLLFADVSRSRAEIPAHTTTTALLFSGFSGLSAVGSAFFDAGWLVG